MFFFFFILFKVRQVHLTWRRGGIQVTSKEGNYKLESTATTKEEKNKIPQYHGNTQERERKKSHFLPPPPLPLPLQKTLAAAEGFVEDPLSQSLSFGVISLRSSLSLLVYFSLPPSSPLKLPRALSQVSPRELQGKGRTHTQDKSSP